MAHHADDLPREHRVRCRLETFEAHHFGHPRDLIVEQGHKRLRRHVARPDTGASGEDENVGRQRAFTHRYADLLDVVGHALSYDNIRGEQRESRHDDVATAVIRIHAAAAVADRDLGATPVLLRGHFAHSRMIRSCPAYTFICSPRRKPISVIPESAASSTARLDGAETAASTGIPAISAFCVSSKLARPEARITCDRSGSNPCVAAQPITLSKALCRPTSSRRHRSAPSL